MSNLGVMAELLNAFEQQLTLARNSAREVSEHVAYLDFAPYRRFRSQIDETMALVCVLEGQLDSIHDRDAHELRAEMIRLNLRMLTLIAGAARAMFSRLQQVSTLPLGAQELFGPELNALREAEAKLSGPDYRTPEADQLLSHIRDSIRLVEGVINRATALPEFDAS